MPCPTPNCENELKALAPETVEVVTLVTLPDVVTAVAVRPSVTIWFAVIGCALTSSVMNGRNNICSIASSDTRRSRANRRSVKPFSLLPENAGISILNRRVDGCPTPIWDRRARDHQNCPGGSLKTSGLLASAT